MKVSQQPLSESLTTTRRKSVVDDTYLYPFLLVGSAHGGYLGDFSTEDVSFAEAIYHRRVDGIVSGFDAFEKWHPWKLRAEGSRSYA